MKISHSLLIMALGVLATATIGYAQDFRSTIPEALARAGESLSRHTTTPSGVAPDMSEILQDTDVIVRGTIGQPTTYLSKDQRDLYTDYPLINPTVLFDPAVSSTGTPGPAKGIIVTILGGGSIQIGGLTFTQKPDALPELPTGAEALFLLKRAGEKYQLAGGYYGAFEITDGQLRKPFVKKEKFANEYRGTSASATTQSWVTAVAKLHQERK
jgi:hypothetical protein